jgi:light-regulated signal transduction histidine kinase (bacteriophytochrome)
MLGSASPLRDIYGNVRGCIGAFMDITEKREAQIKLENTLEELKRSNKDLEQFAYVASHDLQEPIRMIKSYTDLLTNNISERLAGDEKLFFKYIAEGAVRMNELVNALLGYSRLSSQAKEFRTVDCNEIISEVLQDLKAAIDDAKAIINCEKLPLVKGDKVMLRLLFQNLLQNAIKFRGKNNPEVYISGEKKGKYVTVKVKDNGIGIAPEYHDKIFIIFQKLHTRDKYPGTGIGLALCKKIVELHGGQICLNSEPGKGSTFIFTLPLDES